MGVSLCVLNKNLCQSQNTYSDTFVNKTNNTENEKEISLKSKLTYSVKCSNPIFPRQSNKLLSNAYKMIL